MKIYLDNCALGRLFDEQSQPRITAETAAVDHVLNLVVAGRFQWSASEALREEIKKNSDAVRRSDTMRLLTFATDVLTHTASTRDRTHALQQYGFRHFDAQHVAFAEVAQADALLTTDDRLIRLSARCTRLQILTLEVLNPVNWLRKVEPWLTQQA